MLALINPALRKPYIVFDADVILSKTCVGGLSSVYVLNSGMKMLVHFGPSKHILKHLRRTTPTLNHIRSTYLSCSQ